MIAKLLRKKISEKILLPIGKKIPLTPNQITTLTYPLAIIAFLFILQKEFLLSLVFIILSTIMDNLDGAVAKAQNKKTDFGSYYDAITDKIQEIIIMSGFALIGYSLEAFFAISMGLLLSYSKPRAEMIKPLGNPDWPGIGERAERLLIIMAFLIIKIILPESNAIKYGLIFLGLICAVGFIQRFLFGKKIIEE